MNVRHLSKPTEVERTLQGIKRELSDRSTMIAAGVSLSKLLELRNDLNKMVTATGNVQFCLLFNTLEQASDRVTLNEHTLTRRTARVMADIQSSIARVESLISKKVQHQLRKFDAGTKFLDVCSKLASRMGGDFSVEWTAQAADGRKLVPVLRLRYRRPVDDTNYRHFDYNVWLRNGKEFASGFTSIPPQTGWVRCSSIPALCDALTQRIAEDGFNVKPTRKLQ